MNPTEAQQLRQEIVRLKQALAIRPVRVPTRGGRAPDPYTLVRVRGGNVVASGSGWSVPGIMFNATAISVINTGEVSGGAPAEVDTYQDGLAWGYIDGTSTKVFIAWKASPDGGTTTTTDVVTPMILPQDAMVWCKRSIAVPLDGDPATTYPVYLLWRV